jgi:hypothetical protein
MHDHSVGFLALFSGRLHHLSCPGWRKIFGIHWLAGRGLLPHPGHARSAGICDLAAGDFYPCSRFSSTMGPAQADSPVDGPDLAVCFRNGSVRIPDALPMVPSARALAYSVRRSQPITLTPGPKKETDRLSKSCAWL